jgi:hypothetical protein
MGSLAGVVYVLVTYIPALRNAIPPTLLPLIPSIAGAAGTLLGGYFSTHRVTPQELQQALEYAKSVFGLIESGHGNELVSSNELAIQTLPHGPGQFGPLPAFNPANPGPHVYPGINVQGPAVPSDAPAQAEVTSGYPDPTQPTSASSLSSDDSDESGHDAG